MVDTITSLFVATEIYNATHTTVRFHRPGNLTEPILVGRHYNIHAVYFGRDAPKMLTDLKYKHLCLNDIPFRF
jgi:hypothetical protein